MSNQIDITGGARVRGLNGVITGTTGVLSSLPINTANGIPQLDSSGKILVSQLPNSVMEFLGTWNAATNTPTLADGTGNAGDVYLCTVAGTVNFGSGPIVFNDGDYVVYSGSTWERSGGALGTVTSVAASITGNSVGITGSPITTAGTLAFAFAGTNLQYVNGAGNLTTFPTLITSIGLSMPTAFNVANSPLTANGTIAVTAAGFASQYIRGDGTLADFPSSGGGGSSVSYYLNGGTSQGVIGGTTYYEMSKTAVIGTGVDFAKSGNGLIVSFLTDANDPAQLNIPAGNWNYEIYASMSANGGTPQMYAELYKYDGTTFTLISTSSNEIIYDGTALNLYTFAMAVPATTLTLTDRLAVKLYATNSGGKTTTIHTQDGHLCQIITTFSTGITALNGLTTQVQYFQTGTSGTDFNISSTTATHTFNLPTASATNRGALSSADWSTFSAKQNALTLTTTGTSGAATLVGATLNIPNYAPDLSGYVTIATTQTITGHKTFNEATKQDSGLLLKNGVSTSAVSYTSLSGSISNGLVVQLSGSSNQQTLTFQSSTANSYTFPAASGTIALTSNLSAYVPTSRTLTINGTTYDLSADRTWTISTGISGTGTTNYLPKFTGASTIGNSIVQDNGSKITIGGNLQVEYPANGNIAYFRRSGGSYNFALAITGSEVTNTIGFDADWGTTTKPDMIWSMGTAEKMRLTNSGNLGLGVTPSAWNTIKPLEIGNAGNFFAGFQGGSAIYIGAAAYYNTGWKYATTGDGANLLDIGNGVFTFKNAVAGTAGNALTWTSAMTLTAAGRLLLGTTTESTYLLDVNGTGRFSGTLRIDKSITYGIYGPEGYNINAVNTSTSTSKAGNIAFLGYSGNGTSPYQWGIISGEKDSATGDGNYAGSLTFWTTSGGAGGEANSATYKRLTITGTGAATFSSSVAVGGEITSTMGNNSRIFYSGSATTGYQYMSLRNTSGYLLVGIENSTGGAVNSGSSAYASVITTASATDLSLGTNQTQRLKLDGTTGAATFSSSVTATGLQINSATYVPVTINSSYGQVGMNFALNGTTFGGIGSGNNFSADAGIAPTDMGIGTNGTSTGKIIFATGTGYTTRLTIASTGAATFSSSVSVATSNPSSRALSVGGEFSIGSNSSNTYELIAFINSSYARIGPTYQSGGSYVPLTFWTSDTERMRITSGGNLLVGTTTTATGLVQVNGTVYATGFYESSDIRFKNIIETNPNINLSAIDVIKFTRKDNDTSQIRYGYSAQQVQSILPDAVTGSEFLNVNYLDVHTLKIAQLEKEIKELKAKLN